MLAQQVRLCDADDDVVAQRKAVVAAAADEAEVALVEVEGLRSEVVYVDESLDVVLKDFGVEAHVGHARNLGLILLPYLVGHELHLLVLDAGAFGLCGELLHVGGVFAEAFILLLTGALRALHVAGEQTVNHQVGIATYGGGEVRIIIEGEAVVPDVHGAVLCLHHRPERHGFYQLLDVLALHVVEQAVDALGDVFLRPLRAERHAEAGNVLAEVFEFAGVGHVVNAVGQRLGFLLVLVHLAHAFGHRPIGQQHELLDEFVRILRALEIDTGRMSFLINHEAHFLAVEVDGAMLHAGGTQLFGHAVQHDEFVAEVFRRTGSADGAGILRRLLRRCGGLEVLVRSLAQLFEQILHLFVGEAAVAAYDGVDDAVRQHVGLLVHLENDAEAEFFLVGTQRADEVAKAFGQHGHGAIDKIDARGALLGFAVDDAAFEHVVGYVGDVDAHFPDAVLDAPHREGIVEVLGVARVDGEGRDVAEVLASGDFLGSDARVEPFGSGFDLCGIFVRKSELSQYGVHFGVVLAARAQDVDDLAVGAACPFGPVGHTHQRLVAVASALQTFLRDEDVVGQRAVG